MGVYIDMEKPKSCASCDWIAWSNLEQCNVCDRCDGRPIPDNEEVADDCPLIDIDLVRCGECKWSYTDERDGLMWCKVHMSHYRVNADHFCSYGERRADEGAI